MRLLREMRGTPEDAAGDDARTVSQDSLGRMRLLREDREDAGQGMKGQSHTS